jgi:hypothetical protein
LTSALGGSEWSASRFGRFPPEARDTHWIESWVILELFEAQDISYKSETERGDRMGSVAVSCLGDPGFKSRLDDGLFCFPSVPPRIRRHNASYYVTAALFHVISNLLFVNEFHTRYYIN